MSPHRVSVTPTEVSGLATPVAFMTSDNSIYSTRVVTRLHPDCASICEVNVQCTSWQVSSLNVVLKCEALELTSEVIFCER